VYWIIHYEETEKEILHYQALFGGGSHATEHSLREGRKRMHYDLMFLIRTDLSRGATVEILDEIMKIFSSLDKHRTLFGIYESTSSSLNSIHFRDAINAKSATSNECMSSYWKKVAQIPLQDATMKPKSKI
jgi:hypothetical protein